MTEFQSVVILPTSAHVYSPRNFCESQFRLENNLEILLSHEKSKFKWNQELSKHKMKDIHNLKAIASQGDNLASDDVRAGCHLQTGDNAAAGVMVNKEGFFQSLFANIQTN